MAQKIGGNQLKVFETLETQNMQNLGDRIGRVVEFIADYDELIKGGAATLEDNVYKDEGLR